MNYKNRLSFRTIIQYINEPKKIFILLILVLLALFIREYAVNDQSLELKVVKVIDGDTISVLEGGELVKIRLFGIDAPESKQEFGEQARDFLASMILDKRVKIIPKHKDKYDRILAIVEFEGRDINKIMVQSGYAWAYRYYSDLYAEDQDLAREQKLGLWKNNNALEPYKWRKRNQL